MRVEQGEAPKQPGQALAQQASSGEPLAPHGSKVHGSSRAKHKTIVKEGSGLFALRFIARQRRYRSRLIRLCSLWDGPICCSVVALICQINPDNIWRSEVSISLGELRGPTHTRGFHISELLQS